MTQKNYKAVTSLEELRALADRLLESVAAGKPIGFDIETGYDGPDEAKRSLDPTRNFIVGFSITDDPSYARYVPLRHDFAANLDEDAALEIIRPVLTTGQIVAHNAKFEKRNVRAHWDMELSIWSDTIIEAFLLSENKLVGLKPLVEETFGHKMRELDQLFPKLTAKQKSAIRFNALDLTPEVVNYACEDAAWCLQLHLRNHPKVLADRAFLYKVEMEIMEILCDLEDDGVAVDWDAMRAGNEDAMRFNQAQHNEILADLSALCGRPITININSGPQLGSVLYDELGWKTTRKTKAGAASTDAVAMEALSKKYPVVKKILEFREVQARRKRFLEKWPNEYSLSPDGLAHPNVKQTAVGTGRFAVSDPPLQQVPKKSKFTLDSGDSWQFNFRDAIVAPPGHYILDFDYSQVELRVMAGLSQEKTLIDAFNNDLDVHTITAGMMLGLPQDQITPELRSIGKTMNFALLYGMGVRSLADRLAVSQERASELYAAYFSGFSSITTWMDRAKREGKARGFTISKFGRKYTIWELQSSNPAIYSKGERVCVNAPVQGGAADYMKVAMVRVKKALTKAGLWRDGVRLVLNNHDALTFYVRADLNPVDVIKLLRPAVEFPVEGFPRIKAEFSIGHKWGSMQELDESSDVWKDETTGTWSVRTDGPKPEEDEVEYDEEGNEIIAFPELSDDALARLRPAPTTTTKEEPQTNLEALSEERAGASATEAHLPKGDGKRFVIELREAPTMEAYSALLDLLGSHPGTNPVEIKTPEGSITYQRGVSLTPADQGRISLTAGGASVYYPASEVGTEVMAGLTF